MRSMQMGFFLTLAVGCLRPPVSGTGLDRPAIASLIPADATLYGEVDLPTIGQSELLQLDLIARYRDQALGRFGLRTEDLLDATAMALLFALPKGGSGAFVPGIRVTGPVVRHHRGMPLLSRGEHVAAQVPGGSVIGDPSAVAAAIDVLKGVAPALRGSRLQALAAGGSMYRTLRLVTVSPADLLARLPVRPPRHLVARMSTLAVYATLEAGQLYASVTMSGRDATAARDLAAWAERERSSLRTQLHSWRDSAGIFGSALDPALRAVDALSIVVHPGAVKVTAHIDLGPVLSSGLFTVLRTLQIFAP